MSKTDLSRIKPTMKVLADADLFLELFINRAGFVERAEEFLLSLTQCQQISVYVTDLCLERINFYSGKCASGTDEVTTNWIKDMLQNRIVSIDQNLIQQARKLSLQDFDSAIEVACANLLDFGAIVTQHPGNFIGSSLLTLSVKEFIQRQQLEEAWQESRLPTLIVGNFLDFQYLVSELENTETTTQNIVSQSDSNESIMTANNDSPSSSNPKTQQLAVRDKRPTLNNETVAMRMSPSTRQVLEEIAYSYDCNYGGKPWIAGLLEKIGSGELVVVPAPPDANCISSKTSEQTFNARQAVKDYLVKKYQSFLSHSPNNSI